MSDRAKPARRKSPKKPCSICHRWFLPNPRVVKRQRTCGGSECRAKLRAKTQAGWRARNPDYFTARRIQARQAQSPPKPEPLRLPSPLEKLPWDLAQDEFGVAGADFIGVMGTLLMRSTQDEMRRQAIDLKAFTSRLPTPSAQDQMPVGAD
jgi:hypothetical protein